MNSTITETRTDALINTKNARLRHIVERDDAGGWKDEALCGYMWDMLKPPPNGTLCEECEAEMRRRMGV